jgi:hypothetical protein
MHRAGKSLNAISKMLAIKFGRSVSPCTLSRILRTARADSADVRFMIATLRAEAVQAWREAMQTGATMGKHTAAEKLFQATGDVAPDQNKGGGITIIVGAGDGRVFGDMPAPPADFLAADEDAATALPPRRAPFDGPAIIDVPRKPHHE